MFRRDVIEETLYVSNEERMIRTPEGMYTEFGVEYNMGSCPFE